MTTIASDITVLRLHHVRSWRSLHTRIHSCLSPRHVHLVSKVSGRPLGGVYQTLSFDAAYFHTVPSLHLENVTTVDPAIMVQPERSFEAFAPSLSQLDCSRAQGSCLVREKCFILVLSLLQETLDCFHSSLRNSV